MKVTFFCISLHLDTQYLCLSVYNPDTVCHECLHFVFIKFKLSVCTGYGQNGQRKKKNWSKNFLAAFWNMAALVTQTVENLPEMAGDWGSIPGLGSSPGKGNGNPLQFSCPESPMDRDPGGLQSMGPQWIRHDLETEQQEQSPNTSSTLPFLAPTSEAHAS